MIRTSITVRLFASMAIMFTLVLALFYIGQSMFFKQFYLNRLTDKVSTNFEVFITKYMEQEGNTPFISKLKEDFFNENNTWVAIVDSSGTIQDSVNYYIQGKVETEMMESRPQPNKSMLLPRTRRSLPALTPPSETKQLHIPLNNFLIDKKETTSIDRISVKPGDQLYIYGIERDGQAVPLEIHKLRDVSRNVNIQDFQWKNDHLLKRLTSDHNIKQPIELFHSIIRVEEANLPSDHITVLDNYNDILIQSIHDFQAELLLHTSDYDSQLNIVHEEKRGSTKFVKSLHRNNTLSGYALGVTFLQPINEIISISRDYYIYAYLVVFLLILLMTYYYSRIITKPLLQINRITQKMASLDFSEKVPVRSEDEIGALSSSINVLSDNLKTHIKEQQIVNEQLHRDIENERKLETIRKDFISAVSHELKTPLSIIQTCIGVLKDGIAPKKTEYYFHAIENEVQSMDALIKDMLDLAKMESGTYTLTTESYRVVDLIEQVCHKLQVKIDEKHLKLIWDSVEHCDVAIKPSLIEQVLVNIVGNAIKYSASGQSIILSVRRHGNLSCEVHVENTGTHIPEDKLHKLWDPFYRIDASRNRNAGGTGLGLSIVKQILELHGSEYGVRNTKEGVLFYFTLPIWNETTNLSE